MNSLLGGKTLKRKKHNVPWKGWKNKSPNHSQRIKMCKKCKKETETVCIYNPQNFDYYTYYCVICRFIK